LARPTFDWRAQSVTPRSQPRAFGNLRGSLLACGAAPAFARLGGHGHLRRAGSAVDANTGAVIAGALGGWCCDPANPPARFDGSFSIERLPVGHNYVIYAEPLVGVATPGNFSVALGDLCASGGVFACTTPAVDTNFNPRIRPAVR
jgi:hypothetical protein